MATYQKPENALKRAEELIAVGQKQSALQTLYDILASKRFRVWQKPLEKVMLKYIYLCVELRKSQLAKDGLHQYRAISISNIGSLEVVIKSFLEQAEAHAKVAQSKADQISLDIEDLDAEESVESQMLTSISGEDRSNRTDREIVTPWLKFLWETYRTVLEILRPSPKIETLKPNPKLESLYQETAQQAFNFCVRYKRKHEFRRLCDILRTHLQNQLAKYEKQTSTIAPETLHLHLETRFSQLNVASDLELIQEAFKTIQDIQRLIILSKKLLKPSTMATYYKKLSQIFWQSDYLFFHSYALFKHLVLVKNYNKTLPAPELQLLATQVLLSALCVPLQPNKQEDTSPVEYDPYRDKNLRLAAQLGFTVTPKRDLLLSELYSKNLKLNVLPEFSGFVEALEDSTTDPFELVEMIVPKLELLQKYPQLSNYSTHLHKLLFIRLIQQLSQVYDKMRLSNLFKLASFIPRLTAELWLVDAVKNNLVFASIDSRSDALTFSSQALEAKALRTQLSDLTRKLQSAVEAIDPQIVLDKLERKRSILHNLKSSIQAEHQRIVHRNVIIERKKEYLEHKKEEQLKRQKEERDRLRQKQQQHTVQKKKEDADRLSRVQIYSDLNFAAAAAGTTTTATTLSTAKPSDPAKPAAVITSAAVKDHPTAINVTVAGPEAEKAAASQPPTKTKAEEQAEKMQILAKRLDHLERAKREEELPLLQKKLEEQAQRDKLHYSEQVAQFMAAHKTAHAEKLVEKKRYEKVYLHQSEFEAVIAERSHKEYMKWKEQRDVSRKEAERKKMEDEEAERIRKEAEEEETRRRNEEEELERKKEEEEQKRRELEEQQRKQREQDELKKKEDEARKKDEEERKKKEDERREAEEKAKKPDVWRPSFRRNERPLDNPRDRDRDERDRDRDRDRPPVRDDRREYDRDRQPPPRDDRRDFERDRQPPARDDRKDYDRDRDRDRPPVRDDRREYDRDKQPPPRDDRRDFERDRQPPPRDDRRDFERDRQPAGRDDRRDFDRRPGGGRESDSWRSRKESPPRDRRGFDYDRDRDRDSDRRPFGRDDRESERDRGYSTPNQSRDWDVVRKPLPPDERERERDRDRAESQSSWRRQPVDEREKRTEPTRRGTIDDQSLKGSERGGGAPPQRTEGESWRSQRLPPPTREPEPDREKERKQQLDRERDRERPQQQQPPPPQREREKEPSLPRESPKEHLKTEADDGFTTVTKTKRKKR